MRPHRVAWIAVGLGVAAFVACSNDTFVEGDDASSDASDGQATDAPTGHGDGGLVDAGPLEGGSGEACAPVPARPPCGGSCPTADRCCVSTASASCKITCGAGETAFPCFSTQDCLLAGFTGSICCMTGINSVVACPLTLEGDVKPQCITPANCVGGGGSPACLTPADCDAGTCRQAELGFDPSYSFGVCSP